MINQVAAPGAMDVDAEQERNALYGAALWAFLSSSLPLTKLTGAEPEQLAIELKLLGNNPSDEEIQTIIEAQREALNMRQNLAEQMPAIDQDVEQIKPSQKSIDDMKLMIWLNEQSLQANGVPTDINRMLQSFGRLSQNVKAAIDPRLNDLHNALTNGLIKVTNGSYGLSIDLDKIKQLMVAIYPNINQSRLNAPTNELNVRRFFLELVRHEVSRHQINSTLITNSTELNSAGVEAFVNQGLDLPEIPEIPDVQFDVNNILANANSLDGLRSIWSEGREMHQLGIKSGDQFILDPEIVSKYLQFERYVNLNADHIVRVAQRLQTNNQQLDKSAYISALLKKARASFNKVFLAFLLSQVAAKLNDLTSMTLLELELLRLLRNGIKDLSNLDTVALEITNEGFDVKVPIETIHVLTSAADHYMPNDVLRITAPALDIAHAIELSDVQSWDTANIGFTKRDFIQLLNTEDLDAATTTVAQVPEDKRPQLNNVIQKRVSKLFELANVYVKLPDLALTGADLSNNYNGFLSNILTVYSTLPFNSPKREIIIRAVRLLNCSSVLSGLAKQNKEDLIKHVELLDPLSRPEFIDLANLQDLKDKIVFDPSEDPVQQVRELFLYEEAVRKVGLPDTEALDKLEDEIEMLLVENQHTVFSLKIFTDEPDKLEKHKTKVRSLRRLARTSFTDLMRPLNGEVAKLPTSPEFIAYDAIATELAADVDLPGFERTWERANTLILEENWAELKSYLQTVNQLPLKSTKELIFQVANQLLSLVDSGVQLDQDEDVNNETQYRNAIEKLQHYSEWVRGETIAPYIVNLAARLISAIPAADKYITAMIVGETDASGNKFTGKVQRLMNRLALFPEPVREAVKEFNLGYLTNPEGMGESALLEFGRLSEIERYNLINQLEELAADTNLVKFGLRLIEEKKKDNIWMQRGYTFIDDIETLIMLAGTFNTSAWKIFGELTSVINPGEIVNKDTLEAALLVAKLHAETDNDFTFDNPVWEQRTLELLKKVPAKNTLAGLAEPFEHYVQYKTVSFKRFKYVIDQLDLDDEFNRYQGIIAPTENASTVLSILSFDLDRLAKVTKNDAYKALDAVKSLVGANDPFATLLAKLIKTYFG